MVVRVQGSVSGVTRHLNHCSKLGGAHQPQKSSALDDRCVTGYRDRLNIGPFSDRGHWRGVGWAKLHSSEFNRNRTRRIWVLRLAKALDRETIKISRSDEEKGADGVMEGFHQMVRVQPG
ncbi:hypothetical protein PDE_06038 [Penicillium oxalicum 114-2]|uniref:Uncharacterized protein n=1 Tax=Penicillium oxalicum (strain 114-2 / CGMCC 5302) TaxID=933388 RepID=S7ZL82_PENO1|nr:hypothetical protein PDE_06038 [Penicillium oxalicum 114-2]